MRDRLRVGDSFPDTDCGVERGFFLRWFRHWMRSPKGEADLFFAGDLHRNGSGGILALVWAAAQKDPDVSRDHPGAGRDLHMASPPDLAGGMEESWIRRFFSISIISPLYRTYVLFYNKENGTA